MMMTPMELAQLRELVQSVTGIRLEDAKLTALRPRLAEVVSRLGESSLTGLLQQLSRESTFGLGCAWNALLPRVTVNETYFFREMGQLTAFRDQLLPQIVAGKRDRTLRLLSAPCSTGEEPYTLAMLLDEAPVSLWGWNIELWGVDIDPVVIEKAQKGHYTRTAFRQTPEAYREKYFVADGDGYRVGPRLAGRVRFKHGNIFELPRWGEMGAFDAIFCRNMLIYFDRPTQKKLVEIFHRALTPQGVLLLGHSESLMGLSVDFTQRATKQAIFYERRTAEKQVPYGA